MTNAQDEVFTLQLTKPQITLAMTILQSTPMRATGTVNEVKTMHTDIDKTAALLVDILETMAIALLSPQPYHGPR